MISGEGTLRSFSTRHNIGRETFASMANWLGDNPSRSRNRRNMRGNARVVGDLSVNISCVGSRSTDF